MLRCGRTSIVQLVNLIITKVFQLLVGAIANITTVMTIIVNIANLVVVLLLLLMKAVQQGREVALQLQLLVRVP